MRGLNYILSNIIERKASTATFLIISILTVSLFTSSYFYSVHSRSAILEEGLSGVYVDGQIKVYHSYAKQFNVSIPPNDVIAYIKENFTMVSEYCILFDAVSILNVTIKEEHEYWEEPVYYKPSAVVTFTGENFTRTTIKNTIDSSVDPAELKENELLLNERSWLFEYLAKYVGRSIQIIVTCYKYNNSQAYPYIYTANFSIVGTFMPNSGVDAFDDDWGTLLGNYEGLKYILSNGSRIPPALNESVDYRIVIKFDRKQIFSKDFQQIFNEIKRFRNKVEIYFSPFVSVSVYIWEITDSYMFWQMQELFTLVAFSLPSLILAWIVLRFKFETTAIRRRREISALKTRGFTNRMIILLMVTEILIYSLISTLIAIPLGNLISIIILEVSNVQVEFSLASLLLSSFSDIRVFIIVFAISFTLLFLSSVGVMLYAISVEAAEARRYYVAELEEIKLSPFEMVLLVFSMLFALPIIGFAGSFFFFSIILGGFVYGLLYAPPEFYILFAIPIMFFIIMVHILLKAGAKIVVYIKRSIVSRIKGYQGSPILRVISRYIQHRMKTEGFAILALMLVITLAFISVSLAVMGDNYIHDISYYYTGSDISFGINNKWFNETEYILNETLHIDGVSDAAVIYVGHGDYAIQREYYVESGFCLVIAIDEKFLDVAYMEDYFLKREYIQAVINNPKYVLFREEWPRPFEKKPTSVYLNIYNGTHGRISGYYTIFDTIEYFPRVAPLGAVAVVNKAIIGHTLNFTKDAYILVRVDDGADVNNVAELINSTLGGKISHLRVAENYYNTISSYIENRAYFSFLYLNLTVMLFFLTVGQATIYIDKFEKMKKEMVILRTLGLEPAQISKYVYLDTLLNTFVASIFGILLALLQSYNLSRAVLFNMGPLRDVIFPVEYIVPIELWGLILLVLVASTLIGNLPVVYNLKSLNIAREMRYEFG